MKIGSKITRIDSRFPVITPTVLLTAAGISINSPMMLLMIIHRKSGIIVANKVMNIKKNVMVAFDSLESLAAGAAARLAFLAFQNKAPYRTVGMIIENNTNTLTKFNAMLQIELQVGEAWH